MDLTIPEAILLLGIDDESGKPVVSDSTVGMAFAAGAAAQLVLQGRIRIAGEGVADAKPGTFVHADGRADERLEPLVEHLVGRTPQDGLGKLVGLGGAGAPAGKARAQTLEGFAEAGLLARQDQRERARLAQGARGRHERDHDHDRHRAGSHRRPLRSATATRA